MNRMNSAVFARGNAVAVNRPRLSQVNPLVFISPPGGTLLIHSLCGSVDIGEVFLARPMLVNFHAL